MQATEATSQRQAPKSIASRFGRTLAGALIATLLVLPSLVGLRQAPADRDVHTEALGNTSAPTRSYYFAATGKAAKGEFLTTFERYGLERIGYPISDERTENGRTVQYFERVRMEQHPELAGRGYSVLLTRLGADITGALFARVAPFKSTASRLYFSQTGHSLADPFLSYWRTGGSVELFGYPISEPMQQDGLRVQWFERARMEYHPELAKSGKTVQLTHLGKIAYERAGGSAAPAQPQQQQAKPAAPAFSNLESYLFEAINDQRAAAGLRPVQADSSITDLTRARSTDMAERNYFSHTTPEGGKFLDALTGRGITFKYAGEILARNNYPSAEAAQAALQTYLNSPPHKAVLLDGRYNYIGLGHAFSAEDEMQYFTVIFVER
jgi:uncharacterized protein YkwD